MRGTRAKELMKIAIAHHDPKVADKVNMMKFNKSYATGKMLPTGLPELITIPMVVHQNHPNSIRGTYQRAKKAFKQFKASGAGTVKARA